MKKLKRFLKPGGTVTVIEGDHGSTYFYPDSVFARNVIQCQIDLQAKSGGNALIGRSLYPLLRQAGFEDVCVSPRMVYVDSSKPELVDGFIETTFGRGCFVSAQNKDFYQEEQQKKAEEHLQIAADIGRTSNIALEKLMELLSIFYTGEE